MASDLNSAISFTLVSMCMLLLTAILVASEAVAASNWPQRPHMTSNLNSVTPITYVDMSLWLLEASVSLLKGWGGGQLGLIDLRASPQVKMSDIPQKQPLRIWLDIFFEKVEFWDSHYDQLKKIIIWSSKSWEIAALSCSSLNISGPPCRRRERTSKRTPLYADGLSCYGQYAPWWQGKWGHQAK